MRKLPKASDLQSDTVKTGALATLLGMIVAGLQILTMFELVDPIYLERAQAALPTMTVFLGYFVSLFRINLKTRL